MAWHARHYNGGRHMPHSGSIQEVEIKLRLENVAEGRRLLRRHGFRIVRRRLFESNTVFDALRLNLREGGMLLRLREVGRDSILTFKGPPIPGRHKSRQELETWVSNAGVLSNILKNLGLIPVFRYEKYRTEFQDDTHSGVVTLDETPIGIFLELEGVPAWIDATAARMGFSESDYVTMSYGALYQEWRRRRRKRPKDMVFSC